MTAPVCWSTMKWAMYLSAKVVMSVASSHAWSRTWLESFRAVLSSPGTSPKTARSRAAASSRCRRFDLSAEGLSAMRELLDQVFSDGIDNGAHQFASTQLLEQILRG